MPRLILLCGLPGSACAQRWLFTVTQWSAWAGGSASQGSVPAGALRYDAGCRHVAVAWTAEIAAINGRLVHKGRNVALVRFRCSCPERQT